jgi:HK97 gp10 family phage protein
MSLKWTGKRPAVIGSDIVSRAERARAGVLALGQVSAARMEANAKAGAPWHDRTGNARQGLTGSAEVDGDHVRVAIAHTMAYGPFLELGTYKMAAEPILVPTQQEEAPQLISDAAKVVGALL